MNGDLPCFRGGQGQKERFDAILQSLIVKSAENPENVVIGAKQHGSRQRKEDVDSPSSEEYDGRHFDHSFWYNDGY